MWFVACFTPQTPLIIAVWQLVLQKATLSHCESISSVEKESHIGPEAGIEAAWEPGREKNGIAVK